MAGKKYSKRALRQETLQNNYYRRVIETVPAKFQLVLMTLKPGETIPTERHRHIVQFFYIVKGHAKAIIGAKNKVLHLYAGQSLSVYPNTRHTIINASPRTTLKLFTSYSPPEHPARRRNKRQPLK